MSRVDRRDIMSTTHALLVRHPSPEPTESVLAYVLRLAEVNGYPSPWSIYRLAGMKQSEVRTSSMSEQKVASIVGERVSVLPRLSLAHATNGPRRCQLLGQELNPTDVDVVHPKICPQCVKEKGFIEAHWHLVYMIACPIHRCEAVFGCPSCGKRLSWYRPGLNTCRCGASLLLANSVTASPELCALMDSVRSCALGIKPLPIGEDGLPRNQLSSMALRSLLSVIRTLGKIGWHPDADSEKEGAFPLITAAAHAFGNWPTNLFRLLHNEGARSLKASSGGVCSQFESFYVALFKNKAIRNPDDVNFLRSAFLEFVTKQWDKGFVDQKLLRALKGKTSEKRYLTQTEFAARAGIRPVTANRFLRRRHACHMTMRGGSVRRLFIDSDTTAIPPTKPGRILRCRDAARNLSFPVTLLLALKKAGVYKVASTFPTRPGYHIDDIEAFRKRLLACADDTNASVMSTKEVFHLGELLHSPHHSTPSKVKLIVSLFEGSVKAVGNADGTVRGITLERRVMKAWLSAERVSRNGETVSCRQAADKMNCDSSCIPWLTGKGFLQGIETATGFRVLEISLRTFLAEWMSLALLAKSMSTSSRKLRRVCAASGFALMDVPVRSKNRLQPFIRRDLASALTSSKT